MKKSKLDRLFEIFCGEAITVMLNSQTEQTEQTETHIKTLKAHISIQGFLIDACDDYIYLGYDSEIIAQAVRKDLVMHVELMENNIDEIMNSEDFPKDEKGFN